MVHRRAACKGDLGGIRDGCRASAISSHSTGLPASRRSRPCFQSVTSRSRGAWRTA